MEGSTAVGTDQTPTTTEQDEELEGGTHQTQEPPAKKPKKASGSKTATSTGKGTTKKVVTRLTSKIPEEQEESGQEDREDIQETLGNEWAEIVGAVRDPDEEDTGITRKASKGRPGSAKNPIATDGHPRAERSLQARILEMYDRAEEAAESGDHAKAEILLKICEGLCHVATGPAGGAHPPGKDLGATSQVQKVGFLSAIPPKKPNSTVHNAMEVDTTGQSQNPTKENPKPSDGANQQTQRQGGYKGNRFNPRHNKRERDGGGGGSYRKDHNH
ncbi:hypothetical protein PtA15_12A561 [Puccinia triticina]|uniref:Uncharacterized protein n=1 Tax=Puccinia triticina TaxID=208348 RepID=A0ABY7CZF1_9BASI|nr:uncharacterized protein PtA15_12A561 [Puccinia triticina]WAQ90571.1 hypothetical protein PtA15_12A561 [Puccinia triticina]